MQTLIRAFNITLCPSVAILMPDKFYISGAVPFYRPAESALGFAL